MAIEIVFLSVVLRMEAMDPLEKDQKDLTAWLFEWQPDWFRHDGHLAATAFMSPYEARLFGKALEDRCGLLRGRDWAVVDMASGPTFPVDWLDWRGGVGTVAGAWLKAAGPRELVRVPRLSPGEAPEVGSRRKVVKMFGRDSGHDEQEHREDFGRILPDWGGKDMWYLTELDNPGQGFSIRAEPILRQILGE